MTSKEALEIIASNLLWDKYFKKELEIIEKELEVLEIIKRTKIDLNFVESCENYSDYLMALGCVEEDLEENESIEVLTETEYNLLKEWLELL